jgi:multicomponent K+:H+ antiporter subunit A
MSMLEALLATPFAAALLIALLPRVSRRGVAIIAGAAPVLGLALLMLLTGAVFAGEVPAVRHEWLPQAGLAFSLRLDGLAWMFALLVLGIGGLIVLYAAWYLAPGDSARRFFAFLMLFMGAMLGMVIAGNLLLLVVFWELTSISSFLLIGYWFHRSDAREGAQMALVITGAGGLALLAGVLLIGRIVGSYELDDVLAAGDQIRAHALYPWATALVLLGAFTKSAQFPFHFWLPHAMAAPTPVSAYLHSATMVKAGVFLLARMHPALSGTDMWFYTVSSVGAATLLIGAWNAIFQHDLKGLLAYSTISHLGLITLLFGLQTPLAVVAGLFHILNHATFKASLFMAAGIIDHEAKTRDLRRLHGLHKLMPFTTALAVIAALAMAGIPMLNGFLSKEMFFALALDIQQHEVMRIAISITALLAGLLGVAYSLRFVHDIVGGDPKDMAVQPHEPSHFMRIPVEVLVLLCLAVGIFPAFTIAPVLAAAAFGVLGAAMPEYSLALWHGFNLPLAMSIGGVVLGVALYAYLVRYTNLHGDPRHSFGRYLFRWKIGGLKSGARWITRRIENGSLQRYLLLLVLATLLIGAAPFASGGFGGAGLFDGSGGGQSMPLLGWALWAMLVATVACVVRFRRQRLIAVVVLGGVGSLVSLAFVFLSAPDLALTQLLVELVTVALILLAMNYLPTETPVEEPLPRRVRDATVALAAGGGVAAMAWAVLTRPFDTVAGELLALSAPQGGGTNVVNVILVDFRGIDTLGEITVFGIAGIVVHALLRRARLQPDGLPAAPPDPLPIPNVVGRLLFPLAIAVSLYLFLRGHNEPGGGFIAGLVLAVPLLLQYLLSGTRYVEGRLGFNYGRAIGLGLLVAAATGIGSWLVAHPFLTSAHGHPHVPLLGELPIASALAFDIGVYLVVFGSCMLALSMLGHASLNQPAQPAPLPEPHR